jgi:hypothetical protein
LVGAKFSIVTVTLTGDAKALAPMVKAATPIAICVNLIKGLFTKTSDMIILLEY